MISFLITFSSSLYCIAGGVATQLEYVAAGNAAFNPAQTQVLYDILNVGIISYCVDGVTSHFCPSFLHVVSLNCCTCVFKYACTMYS